MSTSVCRHYARRCSMIAPCCGQEVCCHIGHDEARVCSARIDKSKVITIVCDACRHPQDVSNGCVNCRTPFAERWCIPCRLWYDGPGFHCDECGICRRGARRDTRHCFVCRTCFPTTSFDKHICAENALDRKCPCCGEHMHGSRRPCVTMKCGHAVHCDCFMARVRTTYTCPRAECRQSVGDMSSWFHALDVLVQSELEQAARSGRPVTTVTVYCFDCRATSVSRDHRDFKKCGTGGCGSYNTVRVPPSQAHLPFVLPPRSMPEHEDHTPSLE